MQAVCAKVGHESRAAASTQRVAVSSKRVKNNNLNVYQCEDCELWHVGRGRRKPEKNRVRRLKFEGLEDWEE